VIKRRSFPIRKLFFLLSSVNAASAGSFASLFVRRQSSRTQPASLDTEAERGKNMSLSIVTNIGSLVATNALTNNQNALNQSIAQLSSGKRINNAADDPAGLAIALQMSGLLGGLNQAQSNTANDNALMQTADGALANIGNLLTTMQQLATEAADAPLNSSQLGDLNSQYQTLYGQINSIAQGASFNNVSLLNGNTLTFQTGATNAATSQVDVALPTISAAGLLGITLPGQGTAINFTQGAGQNAELVAPSGDGVSVGATAAYTAAGSAANVAAATATNSELNTNNVPASVTITLQSSSAGSSGTLGTDNLTFLVQDSNGQTGTVVLGANQAAINNVDGLGFDLNLGTSGTTVFNVGDKIALTFGAPGAASTLTTQANAQQAITATNNALATLAQDRATVGSGEQELSTVSANLQTYSQNLTSALSNIQDANIASTFAKFTQQSVLQQANVQVLRQADSLPQNLLTLFQ
jgi:flagellin